MQSIFMRKVAISLPQDLVEFSDRAAQQAKSSRSQVISQALADAKVRNERRLAEEGYRFYAGESAEFAQASALAVAEATASYWVGEDDNGSETW
jgi:metal-responsive CopG/Arc/MetJ family transcriptional regulator